MQIKWFGLFVLIALLAGVGCVGSSLAVDNIVLDSGVKKISGWFSAKGEWALFPMPLMENYDPYTNDNNLRCVSLVNGTGHLRAEFQQFDGKHVSVHGYVMEYEKLSDGESVFDKLLSKKYYRNEIVDNYCLRQHIFIVNDILLFND